MNLLLIDSEIPGLDIFMKSCNSNTKYIVYHTKLVSFELLYKKIVSLGQLRYNNLGFVFVNDNGQNKLFIDNRPFITYNKQIQIIENITTSFIKHLVKRYSIKTIDFLGCNLLNDVLWKKYFEFIKSQNNIKVRASDDRTGNLSSGGDWILETTGENVEKIYFNSNIQYWNYLLDSGQSSYSTYIITTDNSNNLYACGRNNQGQLGIGNTSNQDVFVNPTTNIFGKKVISVVGGNEFALLITSDTNNNLYACGINRRGQLGLGDDTSRSTFQNVTTNISGKKIINISTGLEHSLILTDDISNNLYSCGRNDEGQLGIGNNTNQTTFQNVTTNIFNKQITYICAGGYTSYILTDDASNNLYDCGRNNEGQLGIGNNTNQTTFQNITTNISGKKVIMVGGSGYSSYLLTNENPNNLYSTGDNNNYGELGLGDFVNRNVYTNVTTNISGKKIVAISAGFQFCSILTTDTSNNLYTCGKNLSGQLGLGYNSATGINSFTLSSNTILNKYYNGISCGNETLLVTTTDTSNNFYVVGRNNNGQLGLDNSTDINILTNSIINITDKKILFNSLINLDTPNTGSFNSFNYGANNVTYYTTAQDRVTNTISISIITNPELYFPKLIGIIGSAYQLQPSNIAFSEPISFIASSLYLSGVSYQYNINSELLVMSKDSNQLPYYTYDGETVTIYTQFLFAYLVLTVPETRSGSQFSNMNNLIISATDEPVILPNTRLNCTFLNTPSVVVNDANEWDVSASITMNSMFRDSSFNGTITNWKPNNVTDMGYMFYGTTLFNQKISYDPLNGYWDVSAVTNMESIFNNSTLFNNSQGIGGVTEPMNWNLNPNVNLTNTLSNSVLTVANAQTLAPDLLVYLNIGTLSENLGYSNYTINFYNEDDTVGTSNLISGVPKYTFLCSRYNIAGDSLWNFKIDCSATGLSKLSEGSISTDLSRNLLVTGIWYNTPNSVCRFYNVDNTIASTLNYSGLSKQNAFLTKYDNSGNFSWRTRISGTDPNCEILLSNTSSDVNGNVYGIGRNNYLVTIDNANSTSWTTIGNASNMFNSAWVFKYDMDGTGQWAARIASTGGTATDGIVINVDSSSNIYGCGTYDASTSVYNASNALVKSFLNKGNWITKYNPSGSVLWATHLRGTNIKTRNIGYSLNNDIYFSGGFTTSAINFVNQTDISFVSLTNISNANGFIAKYTSDGNCSWAARNGYSLDNTGSGIISACSEKQFQDISYPEEGLKFAIYNGYFEDFSGVDGYYGFGFFYKNYPFCKGTTSDFTNLDTATQNQFGPTPGQEYMSACWYGFFRAKKTGVYTFKTRSDDASYLFINGNLIVNNGGVHAAQDRTGTCNLIAGTYYYIQIFYGVSGGNSLEVSYSEPNDDGTANTSNYIKNASELGTYYVDTEYIGLYDNWINQPMGTDGRYGTDTDVTINNQNENYIKLTLLNRENQNVYLYNRPPINPNIYKYIHFKYKTNRGPNSLYLYYSTSSSFNNSRRISFDINNIDTKNSWRHIVFDMTNETNWFTGNWTYYRLTRDDFGTRIIEFEYFYISDSPKYPLNEPGNSIYVNGVSKAQNISIYNSTFFYNTTGSGLSSTANRFIRTYNGTNNTSDKTYIIKYDLNGSCIWSIYLQSTSNVRGQTTKVDKTGNVYIFGQFDGTLSIKDKSETLIKTLVSVGSFDTFVIVYNGDGEYLWDCLQGSNQNEQVISSSFETVRLLQGQSASMS